MTVLTEARRLNVRHRTRDNDPVAFEDGTLLYMRPAIAREVVGLDADGDIMIPFMDEFCSLTPCCHASGKGSIGAVVCRGCYRPVSYKFGTTEKLVTPRLP